MDSIIDMIIDGEEYIAIKKGISLDRDPSKENFRFAIMTRFWDDGKQTLGLLNAFQGKSHLMQCKTLELPWENNESQISCIPNGEYSVIPYNSPSKGLVYLLEDVENRSMIEIHVGNYNSDILGCILVGDNFAYINNDSEADVTNSKTTFDKLKTVFGYEPFTLFIK